MHRNDRNRRLFRARDWSGYVDDRITDSDVMGFALGIAVVVTYLTMMLGAVLATTDGGGLVAGLHHGLAVLAGVSLVGSFLLAIRESSHWRIQCLLGVAVGVMTIQGLVGGWLWWGAPTSVGTVHLALAMLLFAVTLYTIIWYRSLRTPTIAEAGEPRSSSDRDPTPRTSHTDGTNSRPSTLRVVRSYVSLMKPRLMWLLSLLAVAGIALAVLAGAAVSSVTLVATVAGGVLAVGASGTFNHVYERDRDNRMDRTADRPLVTDTITTGQATLFGVVLAVTGLAILWTWTTAMATFLTAIAILYYSVIYTIVLKPNTTWNIAIGGGAGALPAVIGWAAVTGGIGVPALVLAAIVVLWTPSHFYNLAIVYYDDYSAGDYPMLPLVSGVALTRRRIGYSLGISYLATTVLVSFVALDPGFVFLVTIGGILFLLVYLQQMASPSTRTTYRTFHASNAFLGLLLVALIAQAIVA